MVVVDTSIVLAVYFGEPQGPWAVQQLNQHAEHLRMSTVNLAEALIIFSDRLPAAADEFQQELLSSGIRFVAPDAAHAVVAARARLLFPLNLGDCFAYALVAAEHAPILTLDEDFRVTDLPVILP